MSQYPRHEQPFIELAIHKNPAILDVEKGMQDLMQRIQKIVDSAEHQRHLKAIFSGTKKENIEYIKKRIKKDIQCSVHPSFEQWLDEENNKTVLFYLTLMMSINVYDRNSAYIRYRVLWDKENWRIWESINLNIGS
ncbi:MAG: hypothetical protein HC892_22935 [Saprospiraceae bacterium]|nr:hypothetical protein [Saprospiraceae bacterium]